ncbi:GAF domain-containing protein [Candidatus Electrothrix laxa]
MSLIAKLCKFFVLYLVQAACLWISLEVSTYLQGDALKVFLQDYWLFFYAFPLLTTALIFKEVKNAPLSALVRGPEQQCLAAYSKGQTAWQYNQFAFFFRRQWIFYLLISSVLFFLSLHAVFFPDLSSTVKNTVILVLAFSFLGVNFFTLHRRTRRFLDMQESLHQLGHQVRNEHSQLLKKLAVKGKASPEDSLRHFAETLELIKGYLWTITGEKNIELVIRVALPHQAEEGNIIYQTLARTQGLQESTWLADSISANEGISRYLIEERETCNVLMYRDIKKALRDKVFLEAEDESFIETVKSLVIAPLKAWDGKKKSMIGMVYIVSGRKKAFREEHIDGIRFIADILSDAVASSITVNHMLIMKGNKNARRRQLLEKY